MSDIPRARELLVYALNQTATLPACKACIRQALALMTRKTPNYRAPVYSYPMTRAQVAKAKAMRRHDMPMNIIAKHLGHNIGRISEAINGKRKGV